MMRLECECGRVLGYEARHYGKKVKCAGCGTILTIPEDQDIPFALRPLEDDPPPEPAPRKKRREEEETFHNPRMEDDENFDDEKPRSKRRERDEGALNLVADFLVDQAWLPIVLLLGVVLIPIAIWQGALSSTASTTPQAIRLADLVDKGPGDNRHVIITGALPGEPVAIRTTRKSRRSGAVSHTDSFYVPLLVPGSRDVAGFRVLMLGEADSVARLNESLAKGEFKGLIVNAAETLSSETQGLIRQRYPGKDFSTVHLLQEGKAPLSRTLVLTMFLGGIISGSLSVAMYIVMALFRTT